LVANLGPVRKYLRGGLKLVPDTDNQGGCFFREGYDDETREIFMACMENEIQLIRSNSASSDEGGEEETKEEVEMVVEERVRGEWGECIDRFCGLDDRLQKATLRAMTIPPLLSFLQEMENLISHFSQVRIGDHMLLCLVDGGRRVVWRWD